MDLSNREKNVKKKKKKKKTRRRSIDKLVAPSLNAFGFYWHI